MSRRRRWPADQAKALHAKTRSAVMRMGLMPALPGCGVFASRQAYPAARLKVDRVEERSLPVRWGVSTVASKIDFFALPRAVQERFAASTRGTAPPMPLLYVRAP